MEGTLAFPLSGREDFLQGTVAAAAGRSQAVPLDRIGHWGAGGSGRTLADPGSLQAACLHTQ